MSTPIANIPIASVKTEEDPEVAELLNEMNNNIAPPPIHREVLKKQPLSYQRVVYQEEKQLFHYETAQKAVYLAAIAFIIFYPAILDPVYAKFPAFEKLKENELLVRSILLGAIVYAILWKFNV